MSVIHLKTHFEKTAAGACAECARIRARKWNRNNPGRVKARAQKWRAENRQRDLDNKKAWRIRNIEAVKVHQKKRYDPAKQKIWNAANYAKRKAKAA